MLTFIVHVFDIVGACKDLIVDDVQINIDQFGRQVEHGSLDVIQYGTVNLTWRTAENALDVDANGLIVEIMYFLVNSFLHHILEYVTVDFTKEQSWFSIIMADHHEGIVVKHITVVLSWAAIQIMAGRDGEECIAKRWIVVVNAQNSN